MGIYLNSKAAYTLYKSETEIMRIISIGFRSFTSLSMNPAHAVIHMRNILIELKKDL